MTRLSSVTGFVLSLVLIGQAFAMDSVQQIELDRRSAANGLGKAVVPLLVREKGPGRLNVRDRLLKDLRGSDAKPVVDSTDEQNLLRTHEGTVWFLDVWQDGSAVEYWDENAMRRAHGGVRKVASRMTDENAINLALAFVSSKLRAYMGTAPRDEMVPIGVRSLLRNAQDTVGRSAGTEVVASQVKFRRRVEGIDFIGAGSLVTVTLSNEGETIGFKMDWPTYRVAGASRQVVDMSQIKARMGTASVVAAGASVDIKRINCGYYDQGAIMRDWQAHVQPACRVNYVVTQLANGQPGGMGIEETVPAGETFLNDDAWPETKRLRTTGEMSMDSALSGALNPLPNAK